MDNEKFVENDLELLNRIREHDDVAMDAMIDKYKPLIYKKIKIYRFPESEKEDYFQEGIMVLNKAINTYREDNENKKTFTRYFELLLTNRFNSLYRENRTKNQYVLLNDEQLNTLADESQNDYNPYLDLNTELLSPFEERIFALHFIEKLKIKEVAEHLEVEVKAIYNAINRIRKKLKK